MGPVLGSYTPTCWGIPSGLPSNPGGQATTATGHPRTPGKRTLRQTWGARVGAPFLPGLALGERILRAVKRSEG